ncbi:MAG TPA: hypothetical protein GXX34_01110 [Clostridia bacterium]|nr:hypothetical protein [Clostridia bacterium]
MRRDYVDDWSSYGYGDPYYIDSAYGAGYGYNNNYNHPNYYGPNWSCPGGGYGPGMGCGGYDNWHYGNNWQGCPGGSMTPNELAELMQLVRDTNQCCRQMLQMMQQMHPPGHQNTSAAE